MTKLSSQQAEKILTSILSSLVEEYNGSITLRRNTEVVSLSKFCKNI
jgi:hypothetical protein